MVDHGSSPETREARAAAGDHLRAAWVGELRTYRSARDVGDWRASWRHLERAHILSQSNVGLHLTSHIKMLAFAMSRRDVREILGQLLRIVFVPLGTLTGRLPVGNTGRARVSAFGPMPVSDDLRLYIPLDET